jgi:phosphatidate cytidylyltransferase
MRLTRDPELLAILGGVFALLLLVTAVAWTIRYRAAPAKRDAAENLWARTRSFWLIALLGSSALLTGEWGAIALFFLISVLALREFMTLAPTHASDHRTMVWTFFVIAPLSTGWSPPTGTATASLSVYVFLFVRC